MEGREPKRSKSLCLSVLTKLHNNQSLKPYHLRVRLLLSGTGTQRLGFGLLQTNIGFSINKICKSPTSYNIYPPSDKNITYICDA